MCPLPRKSRGFPHAAISVRLWSSLAGRAQGRILIDTLIGTWLPAWKLKRATKQVAHPKFYLFDCGVARALSGRIAYPPSPEERGALLETLLLGEVRAYLAYAGLRYPLHYWRTHDGVEVDLLCESGAGFVAVEMKASARWDARYNRGLNRLRDELGGGRVTCYGVYEGERPASWGSVRVAAGAGVSEATLERGSTAMSPITATGGVV